MIACASCHPEGGDDGRTWPIALKDLRALVDDVFATRMDRPLLDGPQLGALSRWLGAVPTVPRSPPVDPMAAARGAKVFADPGVGCASCHNGPQLTNRALVDVGTGGVLKVPSLLGLAWRAPLLHDGCAKTLRDRFGPWCGGGDRHGKTSHLNDGEITDLIAFLETL